MRWLVILAMAGCSIGNASPSGSTARHAQLVRSEALDQQDPSADTTNNKELSRTEGSPPPLDEALALGPEVAAAVYQGFLDGWCGCGIR